MGQLRVEKVQELMKQEISQIILRELKDPRIGFVTVTSVECTGDLREAKVYVSLMGNEAQVKACWSGLNSSLGFIRREIGKRIRLRVTPELSFALDKSLDYSAHIQELLLKIKAEDEAKAKDSAPEE
ncbi:MULTISPECIES: 30S ribosome-binding factor RbfA [Selenomonas]|uniref:Ribosome-binding factor A n=1 Tax=Selenomonas ruminantium TaxID=971 RepID=A0A927WJ38_SELRU|nr:MULTISPECIES: 30S ribosome-binding factor RbfA [Selenomonas]MBE6092822.1 30S ribosome-binding factor RbfA [Selenomonas ruminantium]MBQ1866953.1 30S ribosome-binding factor RbfA [Selenomonas sp.]